MPAVVNFGASSTLELDLPPEVLLAECTPRGEPVQDPAEALLAALLAPLGYPPIDQATVPGDRVAVVLDDDLPNTPALVAGAVRALMKGGVSPENIFVLQTKGAEAAGAVHPLSRLAADLVQVVQLVIHDPSRSDNLAYLASSADGKGIYLNRAICDADLVLPLSCVRLQDSLDFRGLYAGLFPAFSDQKTVERFRVPATKSSEKESRRKEADEIGWLLGIRLIAQVVPGGGDKVLHVLAGDVDAIGPHGQQLCAESWSFSIPRRASLVVATIEGGPQEQTWENVARALAAARRVVAGEGAIALCTDLGFRPGPSLMRLADAPDPDAALQKIRKDNAYDTGSALQLAEALKQGPVYLLSRLEDDLVEELGMAPVASASQVARLASRSESCILLAGAQYSHPVASDEATEP